HNLTNLSRHDIILLIEDYTTSIWERNTRNKMPGKSDHVKLFYRNIAQFFFEIDSSRFMQIGRNIWIIRPTQSVSDGAKIKNGARKRFQDVADLSGAGCIAVKFLSADDADLRR
ncbi:MAG: hypothetical protein JW941_13425, partial [Candidatus Coatesbacteria bacterium]|nr:hypothetical protein [Candidatus Coatesbacteria bacterium]